MTEQDADSRRAWSWEEFGIGLVEEGVTEKARPWHRKHLERWGIFPRKHKGRPCEELVVAYVRELGGNPKMSDWMTSQILDAIRWAHGRVLGESWVDLLGLGFRREATSLLNSPCRRGRIQSGWSNQNDS